MEPEKNVKKSDEAPPKSHAQKRPSSSRPTGSYLVSPHLRAGGDER